MKKKVVAHTEWQWILYTIYVKRRSAMSKRESCYKFNVAHSCCLCRLYAYWVDANTVVAIMVNLTQTTVTFDVFCFNDRPNTNIKQKLDDKASERTK